MTLFKDRDLHKPYLIGPHMPPTTSPGHSTLGMCECVTELPLVSNHTDLSFL